jgi:hypothetical protein
VYLIWLFSGMSLVAHSWRYCGTSPASLSAHVSRIEWQVWDGPRCLYLQCYGTSLLFPVHCSRAVPHFPTSATWWDVPLSPTQAVWWDIPFAVGQCTIGTSLLSPIQQHGGTSLSVALPIAWDVPRVPYPVQWDVPAVSYHSQMGCPSYHPFSKMVGHPSCILLSTMGCPCSLLPLTDGTSHLLPIQQDGGTSLMYLTQYNGMSLQSPTTHRWDVPPIVHSAGWWDVPPIAHSAGWWDVPHVPYSVKWDVPAVSYRSQMGHPFP